MLTIMLLCLEIDCKSKRQVSQFGWRGRANEREFYLTLVKINLLTNRLRQKATHISISIVSPPLLLLLPFILNTMTSNNNNNPYLQSDNLMAVVESVRLPPLTISTLTVEVKLRDVSSFSPPVLPPHHYLHPNHHPPSLTRYQTVGWCHQTVQNI